MKNTFILFLTSLFFFGCSGNNSHESTQTYKLTTENVTSVLPEYLQALRTAITNKTPIPTIDPPFFASNGVTFSSEEKKNLATSDEIGNFPVTVFDPSQISKSSINARGIITFEVDTGQKCCFLCGQFGGGICSNCRASECRVGAGWICGEQANSCNPAICALPGLIKVPCVY